MIEWITLRVDHKIRAILDFRDNNIASYKAPILNQLYHFKQAQVEVTPEWFKEKNESADFLSIMKGWWSEGQFRENHSLIEWKTSKFGKSI